MPRYKLKRLFLLILLPISQLLVFIAKRNPEAVEKYYSQGFYAVLSSAINTLTCFVQFSLAELVVIGAILLLIFYIIATIIKIIRNPKKRKFYPFYLFLVNVGAIGAVLVFVFTIFCGLNYYRVSFAEHTGLMIADSTTGDLYELANMLARDANSYRDQVAEDEAGVMVLASGDSADAQADAFDEARKSINQLTKDYGVLGVGSMYFQPKPVRFSSVMSQFGLLGIFFPFTYEANVNVDVPDYIQPAAMVHELAHLRGFMQEEEAEFISYLACVASGNADFQYSGTMMALRYTLNQLYSDSPELYQQVYDSLSDGAQADMQARAAYWRQYQGVGQAISTMANDVYLKANDQPSGTKSYGQMVDLLLAYYAE